MPANFHDQPLATRLQAFNDTAELSSALRTIADRLAPEMAYWLKEAAESLDGLFDLAREAAEHEAARAVNDAIQSRRP